MTDTLLNQEIYRRHAGFKKESESVIRQKASRIWKNQLLGLTPCNLNNLLLQIEIDPKRNALAIVDILSVEGVLLFVNGASQFRVISILDAPNLQQVYWIRPHRLQLLQDLIGEITERFYDEFNAYHSSLLHVQFHLQRGSMIVNSSLILNFYLLGRVLTPNEESKCELEYADQELSGKVSREHLV